ncbi:MAG: uL15 family ribosomal protein [Candidatus Heimdallarchaeota archaeon]|nr:uL15 family ribosomal protein [Candidatus Heimdallarchaeota archaeon]
MIEMTVRTKKKHGKRRGYRTHGWGVVRTHRKSGMRGGVGKAGPKSHHWIQTIKGLRPPIGKHGFIRPRESIKDNYVINVSHLDSMIATLESEGKITKKGAKYEVNLTELGYTKLLAQGEVNTAMNIVVAEASERAIKKIESAGGKVQLSSSD